MNVSQEAKDLILKFLNKDPIQRISIQQAFDHPFFYEKFKFDIAKHDLEWKNGDIYKNIIS